MTAPRRRVLRPPRESSVVDPVCEERLQRRRSQLHEERAALDRWMRKLKRAFHEIEKRQKRVVWMERLLTRIKPS